MLKKISIFLSCILTIQFLSMPFLQARASGITAPKLDVPNFTIAVPDNMPSAYENLSDKYAGSKDEFVEQGFGTNNYKDGLANKLVPPLGFGTTNAVDVFNGVYGDSVKNKNWADFGNALYSEDKFNEQKTLVATSYIDYSKKYTPYTTKETMAEDVRANLKSSPEYLEVKTLTDNTRNNNVEMIEQRKSEIEDNLMNEGNEDKLKHKKDSSIIPNTLAVAGGFTAAVMASTAIGTTVAGVTTFLGVSCAFPPLAVAAAVGVAAAAVIYGACKLVFWGIGEAKGYND